MRSMVLVLSVGTIILSSCESGVSVGVGGGVGTGVGSGGGVGTGVGVESTVPIGGSLDAEERDNLQNNSPKTLRRVDRGQQLTLEDIKRMNNAGISDKKIIDAIQSTGSVYYLSANDMTDLKNAGVSSRVIDYMRQTPYQ
ncbi:MAG: hypothetical protein HYX67_09595 [Candidatus Melainabacteria bacterium]|nr:hypothetical protein [Candidatus Melainabacteria bacterium]